MILVTIVKVLVSIVLGIISGCIISDFIIVRRIIWPLTEEIITLGYENYLNGFSIWEYERSKTFCRLGYYIGHGLCYEASAVLMLMLKGRRKTRFVYGEAIHNPKDKFTDHCWVEVKVCGVWWAIDSVWLFPVPPIPIIFHRFLTRTYAVRKISDKEFFSHKIAVEMAERIKDPKTSYIFHDLVCFRRAYWENEAKNAKTMVIENNKGWHLATEEKNGICWNILLIDVFKVGRPVTQKIIREFVANDRRTLPKRRTFRRALILEDTIRRSREEARCLHEKTGNEIGINLLSFKTFKLTEIAPS